MKKSKTIIVQRKKGDPPIIGKMDLSKLRRMSNKEINRRAQLDIDNPPLTKEELAQFKPVNPVAKIDIRKIREQLGLSQAQFARYFGVSVRTLQEWEQHRHHPNRTARNFLMVIAKEPQAVQRALACFSKDIA